MLVFDQLRKNDPQLQLLTLMVCAGFGTLLAGLWWVQVVNARTYQNDLETQSYRSVRIPAVRGKILDRNGTVLAESRANFSACLYLEELRRQFDTAATREVSRVRKFRQQQMAAQEKQLGRALTKQERRTYGVTLGERNMIRTNAAYAVTSNIVAQISARMRQPLTLNPTNFHRHYTTRLALPFPLMDKLTPEQIGRFEETCADIQGVELIVQATRVYPNQSNAAHLLGYVVRDDSSVEGEEAYFSYRLPDYRGVVGIEGGMDLELRGKAGAKSVLVNNRGFRQGETVWAAAEAGSNVTLTIDLKLQAACEKALRSNVGSDVRGAVVMMDVNTGDVLALASAPASNPNYFITNFPPGEFARWTNEFVGMQKNRATRELYQPASTFKTIVALAALELGLDHTEKIHVEANPNRAGRGVIYVGRDREAINDTVAPGDYDLRRALAKSSNAYFVTVGLRPGVMNRLAELARRLHLGERFGPDVLPLLQESTGHFPTATRLRSQWTPGNTAHICIGQGEMDVTPLQMAVLTSALANGGNVLWPRLVARMETSDTTLPGSPVEFPNRRIRDRLGISPRSLQIVREGMLADTEDPDGTGRFSTVPGLRICGKTGTAERKEKGQIRNTTWFISYAPYQSPKYAVVVMVEDGQHGGGGTCGPVTRDIYKAIQSLEQTNSTTSVVLVKTE